LYNTNFCFSHDSIKLLYYFNVNYFNHFSYNIDDSKLKLKRVIFGIKKNGLFKELVGVYNEDAQDSSGTARDTCTLLLYAVPLHR